MVVRLLVVALMLVGAIPVRLCMCGADDHPLCSKPVSNVPECPTTPDWPALAADPTPVEHHDNDCHYMKPRAIMSQDFQANAVDIPLLIALDSARLESVEPAPVVGGRTRDLHPPPQRPLFLSFCILRN